MLWTIEAVDVWKEPRGVNGSVEMLVGPRMKAAVEEALRPLNFSVPVPDIQSRIDAEAAEMAAAR